MKTHLIIIFSLFTIAVQAQIVNIPDANFKAYLVENSNINTNGDDEIQVSEAAAFSGVINCSNKGISDLTGIEEFTEFFFLNCSYNQLRSLDLSNNTNLELLKCSDNQLTELNLLNNTNLKLLGCSGNQITTLNLSNNITLEVIECYDNQLTSLNLSNNIALINLNCSDNKITNLNISNNTSLKLLKCQNNQLISIDISKNTALDNLYCSNNQIVGINISDNIALVWLDCSGNKLTSLNVANGNNNNFVPNLDANHPFDARNNPNLECIQIDKGFTPPEYWKKDETASWSNDIFYCEPDAVDDLHSAEIMNIYPNPATDIVTIKLNDEVKDKNLQILDLSGKVILRKNISRKTTKIDVSALEKGVYLIKVGGKTRKLIVI